MASPLIRKAAGSQATGCNPAASGSPISSENAWNKDFCLLGALAGSPRKGAKSRQKAGFQS
jgi:hypothetical protein